MGLPEELLRRAEAEAAMQGRNPCELVLEGIQHVLECRAAKSVPQTEEDVSRMDAES